LKHASACSRVQFVFFKALPQSPSMVSGSSFVEQFGQVNSISVLPSDSSSL
jgi:hypothetical protein